nr:glutamate receptor 1.2-like isoform X2 [Ziziphus jujuba var. spinosa]
MHDQSMETKSRSQKILLFIIFLNFLGQYCYAGNISIYDKVHLGVILDMSTKEGKMVHSCISMAISDFYGRHHNYTTRVVLHTRDSKGQHLQVLSSALQLLLKTKVEVIIGAQTRMEAKFLAELGNEAKIPIVSLYRPSSFAPSDNYPFLVHSKQDETSQFKGISALVEAFKWKDVILIHEDLDFESDIVSYMIDLLQESNIRITYRSLITTSYTNEEITKELHKILTFQSTVYIVHLSQDLLYQILINAKQLGMMSKGYAWFMSATTMNLLQFVDSSVFRSMQGVIGLKSYVPASEDLQDFNSRLRRKIYIENPNMEVMESSVYGIRAYDSMWAVAEAVERTKVKPSPVSAKPEIRLNLHDLGKSKPSKHGSILLTEILKRRFRGLSGEFMFENGRNMSSNSFEMVNVIGRGERRIGFWTWAKTGIKEPHGRRNLLSPADLEAILWPGGTTATPKGQFRRGMNVIKLRIGVPMKIGFKELVRVNYDVKKNATIVTGFCTDVFKSAIDLLPYGVEYQFIPFVNASGLRAGTYNDLVHQVNLQPLSLDLWMTTAAFFILTGFIVWLIERPNNQEFQGSLYQQVGIILWFSFSTLVFADREKLTRNLSKFVIIIWVFIVLILTSCYTATLTSMMTIQQMQLHSKGNFLGYQKGPATESAITDLNVNGFKPFLTEEEYVEALTRGSKHGGVSAIVAEIPYIKIFLAKYPKEYSMIRTMSTTNGFGFVFRKGSPLVHDMSRAIEKLREEGELERLEIQWFKSKSISTFDDSSNVPSALNLKNFGGLFLISGFSSGLALILFLTLVFKEKMQLPKPYKLGYLRQQVQDVRKYLFNKVRNVEVGGSNA